MSNSFFIYFFAREKSLVDSEKDTKTSIFAHAFCDFFVELDAG